MSAARTDASTSTVAAVVRLPTERVAAHDGDVARTEASGAELRPFASERVPLTPERLDRGPGGPSG